MIEEKETIIAQEEQNLVQEEQVQEEQKAFPAEYVKELRTEAAKYRMQAKEVKQELELTKKQIEELKQQLENINREKEVQLLKNELKDKVHDTEVALKLIDNSMFDENKNFLFEKFANKYPYLIKASVPAVQKTQSEMLNLEAITWQEVTELAKNDPSWFQKNYQTIMKHFKK